MSTSPTEAAPMNRLPMHTCASCGASIVGGYTHHADPSAETTSSKKVYFGSQRQTIKSTILGIQEELSQLAKAKHRLVDAVDHLDKQQQELERSLLNQQALLAPVRYVPSEVLSEIFIWCLPRVDPNDEFDENIFLDDGVPLLLAEICSRWRAIALSTPQLWTTISVHFPSNVGRVLEAVQMWLKRSGSLPLAVNIRWRSFEKEYLQFANNANWSSLDAILAQADRWRYAYLVLPGKDLRRIAKVQHRLTKLSRVHIDISTREETAVFADLPNLQSVDFLPGTVTSHFQLPWSRLKSSSLHANRAMDCIQWLQQGSNLVYSAFTCDYGRPQPQGPEGSLVTPILERLDIDLTFEGHLRDLVHHLTCPSLRELQISIDCEDMSEEEHLVMSPEPYLSSFLCRSGNRLQRLCLRGSHLDSQDLARCLGVLASLVELELDLDERLGIESENGGFTSTFSSLSPEDLLERMTHHAAGKCPSGSIVLVPQLKRFTVKLQRWKEDGLEQLEELIQSRWAVDSSSSSDVASDVHSVQLLDKVVIGGLPATARLVMPWQDDDPFEEWLEKADEWQEEGLNVIIEDD